MRPNDMMHRRQDFYRVAEAITLLACGTDTAPIARFWSLPRQAWHAVARAGRWLLIGVAVATPLAGQAQQLPLAWTGQPDLPGSAYGSSVGTAGDVNGDGFSDIIVGAPLQDLGGLADRGAAYVYHGGPTFGTFTPAAWRVDGERTGDRYGAAVATAGDVNGDGYADVLVGAPGYDGGQTDEGRVYVYLGGASGLSSTPHRVYEVNQPGAAFGQALAAAGDVDGDGYSDILLAAPKFPNPFLGAIGLAQVYSGGPAGLGMTPDWSAQGLWARFGESVNSAGDVNGDGYGDIIVGEPGNASGGALGAGAAFVYLGSPTGLNAAAAWKVENSEQNAGFGAAVAGADLDGDGYSDAIVGAPGADRSFTDTGLVITYRGGPAGLSTTGQPLDGIEFNGRFGASVATAGDVFGTGTAQLLVGASGSAQVFVPTRQAFWPRFTGHAGMGQAIGPAGDVNGDGFADIIVGAPGGSIGQSGEGLAFVYLGRGGRPLAEETRLGTAIEGLGFSVATAGDVNGDGFADVIAGAPRYANGQVAEGRAQVYIGGAGGLDERAIWSAEGNIASASFGTSVAAAGDVNADGYGDIVVGAPGYLNGQIRTGAAFVYLGRPEGVFAAPVWSRIGALDGQSFGRQVASAGDVNGDGYGDIIITQYSPWRVHVYYGGGNGVTPGPGTVLLGGDESGSSTGLAVAGAGDVNGDGFDDILIGDSGYGPGITRYGRVYLYYGSAAGIADRRIFEFSNPTGRLGESVAGLGDINGDGYGDVAFSEPGVRTGGRVHVFLGSATGPVADPALPDLFGEQVAGGDIDGDGYSDVLASYRAAAFAVRGGSVSRGEFIFSVRTHPDAVPRAAAAGDIDGDGNGDIVVGDVGTQAGSVSVFYGNTSLGLGPNRRSVPRQRRVADSGPLAVVGPSGSLSSANLQMIGHSVIGRVDIRMQYEIKPYGLLLDGTDIQETALWTDSGRAGAPLGVSTTNLLPGTRYHWRMRVKYRPSDSPLALHGRWLTPTANGVQQADFRTEIDSDGDLFFDRLDNCTKVANGPLNTTAAGQGQNDADGDGYGNLCDADLNNSGLVTTADFGLLRSVLNQTAGSSATAAAADLNGSGTVTTADFAILRARLNTAPGPSGLNPPR